ncbi:hypothetical protein ACFQES_26760 [Nonomuraea salmonea]|uniref:hypothetical protein n=1 Tax=Nonomuraea salmonea TaxID=46181 RepID=UPI0036225A4B
MTRPQRVCSMSARVAQAGSGTRSSTASAPRRPRHTGSAGSQRSDHAGRTWHGPPASTTCPEVSTRSAPIAYPEPVTPTTSS